ncbi:MAG: hypothetical protein K4305_07370 [Chlorobium sp.]|uniref:hypothetical protein n=1 Tax=Chlorobium sp. TaxID=1095 RepID=UPI002F404B8C
MHYSNRAPARTAGVHDLNAGLPIQATRPSDSGWRSHGSLKPMREPPGHFSDRKKGRTTDNRPLPHWSAHDPAADLSGCCT